jgi:hypothetical protein
MNTNENQIARKPQGKLEQLSPEKQSWLLEIAAHSNLINVVEALKEHGIETSTSALSRFVRKHREEALLEAGEEMKGSVEALAERGKDGKLREGTLEAVRQRLYERALVSNSPEEARELYAALVKEEGRLKELELEARKVAALEQQVRLQGVRIQVMARQGASGLGAGGGRGEGGGGKGRVKAEVRDAERGEREERVEGAERVEGRSVSRGGAWRRGRFGGGGGIGRGDGRRSRQAGGPSRTGRRSRRS